MKQYPCSKCARVFDSALGLQNHANWHGENARPKAFFPPRAQVNPLSVPSVHEDFMRVDFMVDAEGVASVSLMFDGLVIGDAVAEQDEAERLQQVREESRYAEAHRRARPGCARLRTQLTRESTAVARRIGANTQPSKGCSIWRSSMRSMRTRPSPARLRRSRRTHKQRAALTSHAWGGRSRRSVLGSRQLRAKSMPQRCCALTKPLGSAAGSLRQRTLSSRSSRRGGRVGARSLHAG